MTPGIQPDTTAPVSPAAAAVAAFERRIAAQHASGAPGAQTCGLATDLCDEVVRDVWRGILADLPAEDAAAIERHASLVAHGGYGRREMAPDSDVDLMILHDGRAGRIVADLARRILQELFDAGLQVGQSVRTVAEAVKLAAGDATIYSTLTECRLIAGNAELPERLATRLAALARRSSRRLVERLVEARREEAEKFGQTVALLEPNVKRSTGGLRDIQLVRWLGFTAWGSPSFDELAHMGALSRRDEIGRADV